jgi:hypothetical protein
VAAFSSMASRGMPDHGGLHPARALSRRPGGWPRVRAARRHPGQQAGNRSCNSWASDSNSTSTEGDSAARDRRWSEAITPEHQDGWAGEDHAVDRPAAATARPQRSPRVGESVSVIRQPRRTRSDMITKRIGKENRGRAELNHCPGPPVEPTATQR